MRLDKFLNTRYPSLSRSQVQRFIKDGSVTVNGAVVTKTGTDVAETDAILLNAPLPEMLPERPEADPSVAFEVLYDDTDVVVVNKPSGLVVHPGEKQVLGTLVNGLLARYPELAQVGEDAQRPGIVHRLDKDTSGVMIVARTQAAFEHLKAQFKERATQKAYTALVHGVIDEDEGMIDAPVGRSRSDFRKMAIGRRGVRKPREAVTRFEVVERFDIAPQPERGYTLVTLRPETGRMHQIRVHMASRNHPIVGETVYGTHAETPFSVPRILLHAQSLRVQLPSGEEHTFTAPLPDDFTSVLETVRAL